MTEFNGPPSKSRRLAALMDTSYGRANDQLAARIRWLIISTGIMALLVIALAWWRQSAG